MEDNHFSSQRWEEKREGWWEGRRREEIIVSGFFLVCVWWRETGWRERMTVSAAASCCVRLRKQWEACEHLMLETRWAFFLMTDRLNVWAEFPTCLCVCMKDISAHTDWVSSHCLDPSSRSVSVTDERASALKGISPRWFRITWARRLWSQRAACAVLQWYYIIYNDIIDHYVSWHSTLNQHEFINQMMKGGCDSEIKGKKEQDACTLSF